MEDVLDVYQRPYDPSRPVVCIDETNKQLILEKRIPCKPGEPEKVDSVYVRKSSRRRILPPTSHTTGHAVPHPAVQLT